MTSYLESIAGFFKPIDPTSVFLDFAHDCHLNEPLLTGDATLPQKSVKAVARFVIAVVALPIIGFLGSLYHLAGALVTGGISLGHYFERREINVDKCVQHALLAACNIILKFGAPIAALGYAIAPERVTELHGLVVAEIAGFRASHHLPVRF